MENKNVLNDKELRHVNGGYASNDGLPFDAYRERVILRSHAPKSDPVATVKEEDILEEMKLPDFNLDTLPEIVAIHAPTFG